MPIDTAKNIVILKAPGFSTDTRLDDFIALAETVTSETNFGEKYNYAVALLVLHWLTLDAQGGGSESSSGSGVVGGIKSEKEGDLARSYGGGASGSNAQPSDDYLRSTSFGQELLFLRRSCLFLPRNRCLGNFSA